MPVNGESRANTQIRSARPLLNREKSRTDNEFSKRVQELVVTTESGNEFHKSKYEYYSAHVGSEQVCQEKIPRRIYQNRIYQRSEFTSTIPKNTVKFPQVLSNQSNFFVTENTVFLLNRKYYTYLIMNENRSEFGAATESHKLTSKNQIFKCSCACFLRSVCLKYYLYLRYNRMVIFTKL